MNLKGMMKSINKSGTGCSAVATGSLAATATGLLFSSVNPTPAASQTWGMPLVTYDLKHDTVLSMGILLPNLSWM